MSSSLIIPARTYFQIWSRSEVLGVRISTYEFGGGTQLITHVNVVMVNGLV